MTNSVMIREFKFSRDFRQIKWGATLWYNLLRAFFAGCVYMAISIFADGFMPEIPAWLWPLIWPLAYLLLFLPLAIVAAILSFIPFVGAFGAFIAFLSVAIGDPIVCVVHMIYRKIVPVEAPSCFSLAPIYWVLDVEEELVVS